MAALCALPTRAGGAAPGPFSKPLKIGNLTLRSGLILSPMEAVSCVGFRRLCYDHGAVGLTWTEMVRAAGLQRNNAATFDLVDVFDPDVPTGLQLMAKSPDELRGALARLEQRAGAEGGEHLRNVVAVDLNLGCPSPEVIRIGAGPALLKRRARLREMFEVMAEWRRATPLKVGAVGCKIRLGLNQLERDSKVYLPLAEIANECLDYITVHARHAKQRSRDPPQWEAIGEVKAVCTRIPVIGNGDVCTAEDAERMRAATGCDGVMVARGAIRNPWALRAIGGGGGGGGGEAGTSGAAGGDAAAAGAQRSDWPTEAEVAAAAAAYEAAAQRAGTKEKFVQFHRKNFERLRQVAVTGDTGIKVVTPNTIHLS